ncbi:hypothetical protein EAMG_04585 [Escherichia coli M056]|nr:hypothetical protein EAMG_04585 [Escherichia coli M056]
MRSRGFFLFTEEILLQIKNSRLNVKLPGVVMEIVNVTPKDICRILWHVVASICVIMLAWKLISLI